MAEIRIVTEQHKSDINIPNEPFKLIGRMIPSYTNENWSYSISYFDESDITEMCFPDENYDFDKMKETTVFIGAYVNEACFGLLILQDSWNKYMYLYDLKVSSSYRRCGIATAMLIKAREIAKAKGYNGIYTIGQDNNLNACLFYVNNGFKIGGLDTNVYVGTSQEGKKDILFYSDN